MRTDPTEEMRYSVGDGGWASCLTYAIDEGNANCHVWYLRCSILTNRHVVVLHQSDCRPQGRGIAEMRSGKSRFW